MHSKDMISLLRADLQGKPGMLRIVETLGMRAMPLNFDLGHRLLVRGCCGHLRRDAPPFPRQRFRHRRTTGPPLPYGAT